MVIFRFSSQEENFGSVNHVIGEDDDHDALLAGNRLMEAYGRPTFNDYDSYMWLRSEEDCVQVDISNVRVLHNSFCQGLQVTYRSLLRDGSTRTTNAPPHFFNRGYYSYYSGTPRYHDLNLREDEYITGLRINQGDIVDGITFVTNFREVHFGGHGGNCHNETMTLNSSMKIVAFTGTEYDVLQRVGFYAVSHTWEVVRPYVMLNFLVQNNRAESNRRVGDPTLDPIVRRLINFQVQQNEERIPDEVFQMILQFL